jgi:hypothetical protein
MKVYRETNWYVWSDVAAGRAPGSGSGAVGSGWRALFNGKDLTGWKQNGDEKWIVEKVTIMGESTANKYGYLTTEKSYRDFDLRLKFKGEATGNSGLFFHARKTGIDAEHGPDIEGMQWKWILAWANTPVGCMRVAAEAGW